MHLESHRPVLLLLLAMLPACVPMAVLGQEPQVGQITAPPPFKAISKQERSQIESSEDTKQRLRVTLGLAATRLGQAEKYTETAKYDAALAEVGVYHALIENALKFLSTLKRDSNKTRDLYKRLELTLRSDGPRLTAMRRITPLEFAVWIKEVEDFAREGRTEALNSFYGHTVVRDPEPEREKAAEKPKDPPAPSRTP